MSRTRIRHEWIGVQERKRRVCVFSNVDEWDKSAACDCLWVAALV